MGWDFVELFPGENKAEYLHRQFSPWAVIAGGYGVDHSNEYYLAVKAGPGEPVIGVAILLQILDGKFGYKDMDENCGPCISHAPRKVLQVLDPTSNEIALIWRSRCETYLERRKVVKDNFKTGAIVETNPLAWRNVGTFTRLRVVDAKRRHVRGIFPDGTESTLLRVSLGDLIRNVV